MRSCTVRNGEVRVEIRRIGGTKLAGAVLKVWHSQNRIGTWLYASKMRKLGAALIQMADEIEEER